MRESLGLTPIKSKEPEKVVENFSDDDCCILEMRSPDEKDLFANKKQM